MWTKSRVGRPGLVLASLLLAPVGCGTPPPAPELDASAVPDLMVTVAGDASAVPSDMTKVPDLWVADLLVVTGGTRVVSGKVRLVGVTSDDQIIFFDEAGAVSAVPVGGGVKQTIDAGGEVVLISGRLVLSWHAINPSNSTGKLTLWSAAGGVHADVALQSIFGSGIASSDGQFVLVHDQASTSGALADLWVMKSDGSGAKMAVSQVVTGAGCRPQLASAGGKFLASHCAAGADGGATAAQISVIDPQSGALTVLLAQASSTFSVDKNGTRVLVISPTGAASLVGLDGSNLVPLDSQDVVVEGSVTDGTAVVYVTTTNKLKRALVATPASSTTLVDNGVLGLDSINADFTFVTYHGAVSLNGDFTDLWGTSATAPMSPISLSPSTTSAQGGSFGDSFSDDGKRAIFFTEVATTGAGSLKSAKISNVLDAGFTTSAHGTNVWIALAGAGGRIVFNDGYQVTSTSPRRGRADVKVVDTITDGGKTLIATTAEQEIALSSDRKQVVYVHAADSTLAGIYVAPIQ